MTWLRFRRRQDSGTRDECSAAPCGETISTLEAERLEAARNDWADWYLAQHNVLAPRVGCGLSCPCCGHPVLPERGSGERCVECGWYDDGQDDHDSQVVRGGPNGPLSLDAARRQYVVRGGIPCRRDCDPDPV